MIACRLLSFGEFRTAVLVSQHEQRPIYPEQSLSRACAKPILHLPLPRHCICICSHYYPILQRTVADMDWFPGRGILQPAHFQMSTRFMEPSPTQCHCRKRFGMKATEQTRRRSFQVLQTRTWGYLQCVLRKDRRHSGNILIQMSGMLLLQLDWKGRAKSNDLEGSGFE